MSEAQYCDLEDPMIELGALSKALRRRAMKKMDDKSKMHIILHSIRNYLDHIHDDQYEHYGAVTETSHKEHCGPRVVT